MTTPNKLNEAGRDMLLEDAERIRGEVIDFSHQAVKLYLGIDIARLRESEGDGLSEFFVLIDLLESPDYETRAMLTVRLESSRLNSPDSTPSSTDSLIIMYPVPNELDFTDENFSVEDIPETDGVYFVKETNGTKSYFAVVRKVAYEYVPTEIVDCDLLEGDIDFGIAQLNGLTVKSGVPVLATLLEDLINMKGVAQRSFHRGTFLEQE